MAMTSHELRTPLVGIEGIADSMLDGDSGELSEEAKENLKLISMSGRRLSTLVNDILDLSKLKYSDLKLSKSAVDIRQVTDITIRFLQTVFTGKNIKIKNQITNDIPYIYGDTNRIQQIMNNLIDNAIKYTKQGEVIVYARRIKDFLEITVEDTGIGIPQDKITTIFKPFEQVDSSETKQYKGFGLGLSIIKQLVELHSGSIHVESKPGTGSRFSFTMPIYLKKYKPEDNQPAESESGHYPVEAETGTHPSIEVDASGNPVPTIGKKENFVTRVNEKSGEYILIVDDETINLKILSNYLGHEGYNVKTAEDGYKALDIIDTGSPPDLVLLDIMMPGMSGYEVCRKIRQNYTLYDLPVLMCTAKTQIMDIVTGLEAGANDYLPKPFDRRELLARVNTLIKLKRTLNEYNVSRLKNLQERMNPHFLFNAIHAIHSLIHIDAKKADTGIIKLAEIYRFLMEKSLNPMVDFSEEWEFVKSYLDFEMIRFPDILTYDLQIKGDFNGVKIPPLILQPLVENGIKHGLRKKNSPGPGKLEIRADKEGDTITFYVLDDGPGVNCSDVYARSIGNIRERINFYFKHSTVTLENREECGAKATITFQSLV
jgi:two-component system, sensor histidine kinase ChiS